MTCRFLHLEPVCSSTWHKAGTLLYAFITKQVGPIGITPKFQSIDLMTIAPARSVMLNWTRVSVCLAPLQPDKRQRWIKKIIKKNLFHTPCKGLKIQPTLATLNWVLLVSGSGCIYKQRKLNIQACHVENRCWLSAVLQWCVGCLLIWASRPTGTFMHSGPAKC